eukprot:scaffold39073_cov186-Skeletonema_marinoi.AAC.8
MKFSTTCVNLVAILTAVAGSASAFAPITMSAVRKSSSASTSLKSTVAPSIPSTDTAADTTVASIPKFAQRWRKSTKQLATLGPASSTLEMIETLFLAGADIFRLNFSHGSQEQKQELLTMIREVEEKYSHPIAVLGDLQGPKLRVSVHNQ